MGVPGNKMIKCLAIALQKAALKKSLKVDYQIFYLINYIQ